MSREAWQATVHSVTKSWACLSKHTHKEIIGEAVRGKYSIIMYYSMYVIAKKIVARVEMVPLYSFHKT